MTRLDDVAGWDVVVVGSANLDVSLDVAELPRPGETVLATGRRQGPGGKGANQAIAAARAGARTAFVGAVGTDEGGKLLRSELTGAGVSDLCLRASAAPTGTAYVMVERSGENAIVVDPGANAALLDLDEADLEVVRSARVVLCQLEIPLGTVAAAARGARGLAILNAAPAQELPAQLTGGLDVLVVNEHEARVTARGGSSLDDAVAALLEQVPEVVVTLGAAGALLARRGRESVHVPGLPARVVVDTTGAGDTFCGAFAAARAAGRDAVAATELACAAATLSVERSGAGRSAPTLAQVQERLAGQG